VSWFAQKTKETTEIDPRLHDSQANAASPKTLAKRALRLFIGKPCARICSGSAPPGAGCLASRGRNAIYAHLNAVYSLVAWWAAEGREIDRARRALRLGRLELSDREDPFAAIIRCTADPTKADKRTRSKWSRLMRYAAAYKPVSEPLDQFIRRRGGINACAARFARCMGESGNDQV
jgi:hypothetical protein